VPAQEASSIRSPQTNSALVPNGTRAPPGGRAARAARRGRLGAPRPRRPGRGLLIRQRDAGNGTFVRLRRDELAARFPGLLELIADLTPNT
jgi:hypothetical protein